MDNEEGANKALSLARGYLESGDLISAKRLALKSQKLAPSSASSAILKEIEAAESNPGLRQRHKPSASNGSAGEGTAKPTAESSSRASAASAKPDPKKPVRPEPSSSSASSRSYTPDQVAVVKRITKCSSTAYYEILSIEKSSSDSEIKKAYRKHSLSVHPDKNSAPGADEAFKLVSTAFQILSDPDKRAHYDRYGGNPESRFNSAASSSGFGGGSPFGPGFAGRRPGGMAGGAEVTPEELFNMFFGGGGAGMRGSPFGGGFGGPGMQTFSFGPGGFQQRGGFARRPHAGGGQQNDNTPAWLQLLPILFLLGFMVLSQASSLFYTPPPPDPAFSFEPTVRHTLHRQTQNLKADYYVNIPDYQQSHLFKQLRELNPSLQDQLNGLDQHTTPNFQPVKRDEDSATTPSWSTPLKLPRSFREFEGRVEQQLVQQLQLRCENESDRRSRQLQAASGFFGVGRNEQRLAELRAQSLPNCDRLQKMGFRVSHRYM